MDVDKVSIANARANATLARAETDLVRKLDLIAAAVEELANAFGRPSGIAHVDSKGHPNRLFGNPD